MAVAAENEIAEFVLASVAAAGGLSRDELTAATSLFEANVDSLTLVAIVARAELTFGVELGEDESAELVEARDLGALCVALARCVARARRGESARNAEFSELRGAAPESSMESSGFMVKPRE